MFFTDAGSTTCSSAVESLLFLSGKFIMMGGCSSMLRLYLPLSRPVWFYTWPLRCCCDGELASPKLPFLLYVYVGIRQAKMAAIAGTRPSITTNAIIIEMIAAIFLLTGLCRCKNELGLRLVGLQFDLLSSIVSKPEFFRVGLIDTDKFVGGDQNLTTKVTFLSTYPFPWLVAWSVFSWVSVTT